MEIICKSWPLFFPLFISLSFFSIKNTSTVVCYCLPQLYFSFVLTFPNIALKFVLRACEVVWGCSVPWEHLSLDFRGQLIFVSKADPLNGEVFC